LFETQNLRFDISVANHFIVSNIEISNETISGIPFYILAAFADIQAKVDYFQTFRFRDFPVRLEFYHLHRFTQTIRNVSDFEC